MQLRLQSRSADSTREIGREIGSRARRGEVILLIGDLGSGKTTLTQGILQGLGSDEFARSPTFVLVNEYDARIPLYHMDLYRLVSFEDIDGLGLDDYLFGDGLCVIEWADKAEGYFLVDHLAVSIEVTGDNLRTLTLLSCTDRRYADLLESLARTSTAAIAVSG